MTGFDVYNRCMALLGYTYKEDEIITGKTLKARFPEMLGQILLDLKIENVSDLSDDIPVTSKQIDAVVYGCAMLLSLSEGDADKNRIFTSLYNGKRITALSEKCLVEDTMPTTSGGV